LKKISKKLKDFSSEVKKELALQKKINKAWLKKGVRIQNPETVNICSETILEPGVVIEKNCTILQSVIRAGTLIKQGTRIEKSIIAQDCVLGPYAHLRPGNEIGRNVKIGNFVEVKNSLLKDGVKASHLSYIGDAEIGKNTNIGCGFITCNYDGKNKFKTIIEEEVFIGSDSQVVAPVKIGAHSYIASSTTVTEDVPRESLVLSRGKQITKPGYAKKYSSKGKTLCAES
jgi:bifunctional UDP-N-acetylglucosamine pyrophosphorylase/glucosamine-1-phosphate N-acetyltransferase